MNQILHFYWFRYTSDILKSTLVHYEIMKTLFHCGSFDNVHCTCTCKYIDLIIFLDTNVMYNVCTGGLLKKALTLLLLPGYLQLTELNTVSSSVSCHYKRSRITCFFVYKCTLQIVQYMYSMQLNINYMYMYIEYITTCTCINCYYSCTVLQSSLGSRSLLQDVRPLCCHGNHRHSSTDR